MLAREKEHALDQSKEMAKVKAHLMKLNADKLQNDELEKRVEQTDKELKQLNDKCDHLEENLTQQMKTNLINLRDRDQKLAGMDILSNH